jgi:hypothetical protein
MAQRDPRCVFVAENLIQANLVVSWLEQQGISAHVADLNSHDLYDALAPFAFATAGARGFEVWVEDPKQQGAAASLLTQREWARVAKGVQADISEEGVPVICENCGRVSFFPVDQRGTCQNCPHCGAYVDVGEEEDEPGDEAEDRSPSSDGIQRPPYLSRESAD